MLFLDASREKRGDLLEWWAMDTVNKVFGQLSFGKEVVQGIGEFMEKFGV